MLTSLIPPATGQPLRRNRALGMPGPRRANGNLVGGRTVTGLQFAGPYSLPHEGHAVQGGGREGVAAAQHHQRVGSHVLLPQRLERRVHDHVHDLQRKSVGSRALDMSLFCIIIIIPANFFKQPTVPETNVDVSHGGAQILYSLFCADWKTIGGSITQESAMGVTSIFFKTADQLKKGRPALRQCDI